MTISFINEIKKLPEQFAATFLPVQLGRFENRAIVFDERQCKVRQIARLTRFYAHESCAQCSQCREGTAWITRIMERIRDGLGTAEDLDTLVAIADGMSGKTICVLSDSCATPVMSGLKKFRHEFEAKIAANPSVVTVPGAFRASAA
jgi:NADH-quinone oxidoreductase subunit F